MFSCQNTTPSDSKYSFISIHEICSLSHCGMIFRPHVETLHIFCMYFYTSLDVLFRNNTAELKLMTLSTIRITVRPLRNILSPSIPLFNHSLFSYTVSLNLRCVDWFHALCAFFFYGPHLPTGLSSETYAHWLTKHTEDGTNSRVSKRGTYAAKLRIGIQVV